jgi:hypothetical protein
MTQQHPITPPEELVASMIEQAFNPLGATGLSNPDQLTGAFADLVTRAAQWGADQELEACCEWVKSKQTYWAQDELRAARRPKPQSLKEQALDELHISFDRGYLKEGAADTIRRALEQLPD